MSLFRDESHYQNLFNKEPVFHCPICNTRLETDWVDNGFGRYSIQVSPYVCFGCEWSERGCSECIYEKCFSWEKCGGKALIKEDEKEKINNKKDESIN